MNDPLLLEGKEVIAKPYLYDEVMTNNKDEIGPDPSLPDYEGVPAQISGVLVVTRPTRQTAMRSDGSVKTCNAPTMAFYVSGIPVDPRSLQEAVAKANPHHDRLGRFASADEESMPRRPTGKAMPEEQEAWAKEIDSHPSPLMKKLVKRKDAPRSIADLRPGDVLRETWRKGRQGTGADADKPGETLSTQYLTIESVRFHDGLPARPGDKRVPPFTTVVARRPSGEMSYWSSLVGAPDLDLVIQANDPFPPQPKWNRTVNGFDYTFHDADIVREYLGSMPEPTTPYSEAQYKDTKSPPRLFLGGERYYQSEKEGVTKTDPVYGSIRILPSIRLVGFDGILPPEPASQAQREDFSWEYRKDMAVWSHYPEAARQIAQGVDAMKKKGISSSALDKIQVYTDPPVIDAEDDTHGDAYAYCFGQEVTIKSKYLVAMAEDYRRTHGMPLDGYADSHGLALVGKMITRDINSGFHPDKDGHSAVESIMVHEVGHALLNQIEEQGQNRAGEFINRVLGPEGLGLKWTVQEAWNAPFKDTDIVVGQPKTWRRLLAGNGGDVHTALHGHWYHDAKRVSRMVSGYAAKNFHEMVAEAFSEGILSDHPRKVAKLVVKLLGEYTQ